MAISFNDIPENLRTPGSFIEFEPRAANWSELKKVLLIGYANDGEGDGNEGEIYPISRTDIARTRFGYTSMLAQMAAAFKDNGPDLDLYAIALTKPVAQANAYGAINIDEDATTASVFNVWINAIKVAISVNAEDTADVIATNLTAAINNDPFMPVTAEATDANIKLTAKWPDALGNSITLNTTLYQNKNKVAHTLTPMAYGAGTPDLQQVIDVMGEQQWHYIVNPFMSEEQLRLLEDEMDSRWGPMRQIDGRVFMARSGSYDAIRDFGKQYNCPHFTCLGIFNSPTPHWLAATINCAVAASHLDIDPARPLQDLELVGMIAPEFRPNRAERNVLLYSGIATFQIEFDGECQIERQITMYQKNDQSFSDDAYLDIQVPETLSMMRWLQRYTVYGTFPRYKLARSTENYGPGQKIVTPAMVKAELLNLYENVFMFEKGWVQDFEHYKKTLLVEVHPDDPDRLDYRDQPTLIGQFRILAGQVAFKP